MTSLCYLAKACPELVQLLITVDSAILPFLTVPVPYDDDGMTMTQHPPPLLRRQLSLLTVYASPGHLN